MDIPLIIISFLAGICLSLFFDFKEKFYNIADLVTNIGLIVLLLAMGAKIAADKDIFLNLAELGWQALMLTVASIFVSVLLVKFFCPPFLTTRNGGQREEKKKNKNNYFSFYIILILIFGFIVGRLFSQIFALIDLAMIFSYAEGLLLFGIGIAIGRNKGLLREAWRYGPKIVLCPLLIALGSIIGSLIAGIFLGMAKNEAAAIGAGFGWYSLTGIILSHSYSVEVGTLAFLSNFLRELFTIILLPYFVKYLGPTASIAPGGATTMDVTLPVLKLVGGEEIVIPAFISGLILSILVPILVPLLINF